mmetsp:Transcript_433/g.631  ORF Transcript_433/g.631 Transcript_433/m.631 type:complete len:98 (+) Transcript_433:353-646(+)
MPAQQPLTDPVSSRTSTEGLGHANGGHVRNSCIKARAENGIHIALSISSKNIPPTTSLLIMFPSTRMTDSSSKYSGSIANMLVSLRFKNGISIDTAA